MQAPAVGLLPSQRQLFQTISSPLRGRTLLYFPPDYHPNPYVLQLFAIRLVKLKKILMFTGYAVSPAHYVIVEDLGCVPTIYSSALSLVLVYGPQIVIAFTSLVFICKSHLHNLSAFCHL
jgi:Pheromone A receptor